MSILNRTIAAILALGLAVSAAAQKTKPQSAPAGQTSSSSGKPAPSAAEHKAAGVPSSWNKVPIPRLHDFKPQEPRRVELPNGLVVFFQEDHELVCGSREQLMTEVRKTVLHEIGHHFGLSEADLDRLGYG